MKKVMSFFPQGSSPFMKNVKVQMEVQNFSHIKGEIEGSGPALQNLPLKSPAIIELNVKLIDA